jgi:hypothetical protein
MKTLKATILILLVFFASACSKDESETPIVYGEENPLFAFLSRMPNIHSYDDALEGTTQMGYIFKPTVKGKINSLTVKIPAINSALKVFIWDKATIALLRTETINVTTANTDIVKVISPLTLEKDKEYLISIYTDDYYFHSTNNSSEVPYPIIAANIQILGTRSGYGELFPQAGGSSNGYTGDIGFNFQRTE